MSAVDTCADCCPATDSASIDFELPEARIATEPAEVRGAGRDDVRLMVASRYEGTIVHDRFPAVADLLVPGDLLVVNVSGTLPASLPAVRADGTALRLHLSTHLSGARWSVELREPAGVGSLPWWDGRAGEVVALPDGGRAELVGPYSPLGGPLGPYSPLGPSPAEALGRGTRLWAADLRLPVPLEQYLDEHGGPIRYGVGGQPWPMVAYQTVYAAEPGSAEMPSAGRAFTADLLTRLVARGVGVAPLVLHAGVSSPESHEPPYPEQYQVPARTASLVNTTRAEGGRVVATGTTVVRALETCADEAGSVRAGSGWTDLVIGSGSDSGSDSGCSPAGKSSRRTRVVDGLLTGWHEPGASHLRLLEAVAGRPLLERCYEAALADGYLWHEFGDLLLLLP